MRQGLRGAASGGIAALALLGIAAAAQAGDEASYQAICKENAALEQCDCLLGELKGKLSPGDYQAFLTVSVASAEDPGKTLQVMREQVSSDEEMLDMTQRIATAVSPAAETCGIAPPR